MAPRLAACLGVGILLAGCSALPFDTAAVDPSSPIAAEVAKAARQERPFPTFAQIPAKPDDERPARAFGAAAAEALAMRDQIERATAPGTWSLENSENFAARGRSAAGADEASTEREGAAEAFARRGQERATPPPPPK